MRRDLATEAVRLVYDRLRFVVGEVHPAVQHAVGREVVTAGGEGFYPAVALGHPLSPPPAGGPPPPPPAGAPGAAERPQPRPHPSPPQRRTRAGGRPKT